MEREREIEILMMDRCTKAEAERFLNNGTIIFEDLEENLESYLEEWDHMDEDEKEKVRYMVQNKDAGYITDWEIVVDNNKAYYIQYFN